MAFRPCHGLGCHGCNHVGRFLPLSFFCECSRQLPGRKSEYSDLPALYSIQPIAVETLEPINESAVDFLRELGRSISSKFEKERQTAYLFRGYQSLCSDIMQLFYTTAFHQVPSRLLKYWGRNRRQIRTSCCPDSICNAFGWTNGISKRRCWSGWTLNLTWHPLLCHRKPGSDDSWYWPDATAARYTVCAGRVWLCARR